MNTTRYYLVSLFVIFFTATCFPQDDQTVYVTKSGKKYHRVTCSYVKNGASSISLRSAAVSHSPCSVCKPPTLSNITPQKISNEQKDSTRSYQGSGVETTPSGKTIYTGPKGGKYYYNKKGKKVYVRKKK